MRILIVHNFYQHQGGEDTVVQQEALELSKEHTVEIIHTKNKKGLIGLFQYVFYPYNIFKSKKLLKSIQLFNPDVVHIHNLHYGIGPWIIKTLRKKNYPVVMTLHNFRIICPSATLFYNNKLHTESIYEDFPTTALKNKALEKSIIKTFLTAFSYWFHKKLKTWQNVNRFFVFSDFAKQIFSSSTLNIADEKFIIKPNFLNRPIDSKKTFDTTFLYIGRLSEEKGILELLKAIEGTVYTLNICGTGPLENIVKQYSNNNKNIVYLGFQEKKQISQHLQTCSALLVPSICYEGMPMTIIEAFAVGTPVLCSNIGILQTMVVDNKTGLHFDPYNSDTIHECLEKWSLLSLEEKMELSLNCKDEYQNKYSVSKNIKILNDVYKEVIIENTKK